MRPLWQFNLLVPAPRNAHTRYWHGFDGIFDDSVGNDPWFDPLCVEFARNSRDCLRVHFPSVGASEHSTAYTEKFSVAQAKELPHIDNLLANPGLHHISARYGQLADLIDHVDESSDEL